VGGKIAIRLAQGSAGRARGLPLFLLASGLRTPDDEWVAGEDKENVRLLAVWSTWRGPQWPEGCGGRNGLTPEVISGAAGVLSAQDARILAPSAA